MSPHYQTLLDEIQLFMPYSKTGELKLFSNACVSSTPSASSEQGCAGNPPWKMLGCDRAAVRTRLCTETLVILLMRQELLIAEVILQVLERFTGALPIRISITSGYPYRVRIRPSRYLIASLHVMPGSGRLMA